MCFRKKHKIFLQRTHIRTHCSRMNPMPYIFEIFYKITNKCCAASVGSCFVQITLIQEYLCTYGEPAKVK